jgi:hypothetical protein
MILVVTQAIFGILRVCLGENVTRVGRASNKRWSSECNNITTFEVALFVIKSLKLF